MRAPTSRDALRWFNVDVESNYRIEQLARRRIPASWFAFDADTVLRIGL